MLRNFTTGMNKIKEYISSILNLILPKDSEIAEIENMSEADIANSVPEANEINNNKGSSYETSCQPRLTLDSV